MLHGLPRIGLKELLSLTSIPRPSPSLFFFFFFFSSQCGVTIKPRTLSAIKHSLFGARGSNRPFLDFVRRSPSSPSFMSIFEYNGSALIAMVGKNCFAIASDRRLGVQLQTIATDFQRIYKVHDRLFLGLSGLATDAQTLYQRLVFRHKLYQLREERDMKPQTFASLVSALLYEKRFGPYFCQPVIAGLGDEDKPFICTMDSIGAKELAKDFVVAGTASESLYGACEAMFKPDMEAEELFETVSQALLSSVDRDCLSGWGGHVYVVTPTEVREQILKGRMD